MLLNKIRNKKLIKAFSDDLSNKDHEGNLIEQRLVKAKDENMYIVLHIQFGNEDGTLSHRGKYEIQNNKCKKIGELKYAFYEDDEQQYMKLCDIIFNEKYRNIGLGSIVINLFELKAKTYGAYYIDGELSSTDEETLEDKELRDNFYIKRGYEIINSNRIYKEL